MTLLLTISVRQLLLHTELCTSCVRVCFGDHGQVLYGSNYWQRGPSDTHGASLSGPSGMQPPSPHPPFFLSFSSDFYLFLAPSVFYSLPLFLERVLSRSLCTKLLSHEPWQRGQGDPPPHPVYFIYFYRRHSSPSHLHLRV